MVSILVVGDLHFSERSAKIMPYVIRGVIKSIAKYKPDLVVFLGDTLDRFRIIDSIWHGMATEFLIDTSLDVPILLLIGNHDIDNKNHFLSDNHGFKALRYFQTVTLADRQAMEVEVKGLKFLGVPYCPNGRFMEGVRTYEGDLQGITAIFAHQEFKGCNMNGYPSKHGDSWPLGAPLVISGHIHQHQKHQINVWYPGSPYQDKSDEPLDKSISVYTFTPGEPFPKESRIYLDVPKKYRLKIDASKYKELVVDPKHIYVVSVADVESKLAKWRISDKTDLIVRHGGKVNFKSTDMISDEMLEKFETIPTIQSMVFNYIKDRDDLQAIHALVYN